MINATIFRDENVIPGIDYEYILKSVDIFSNESIPSDISTTKAYRPVTETLEIRNNIVYPLSIESEKNKAYIYYNLTKESKVKIQIFDINGKLINTLVDSVQAPYSGNLPYCVEWDAKDLEKEIVGSGVYFCVIDVDGKKAIKRIVVIK